MPNRTAAFMLNSAAAAMALVNATSVPYLLPWCFGINLQQFLLWTDSVSDEKFGNDG